MKAPGRLRCAVRMLAMWLVAVVVSLAPSAAAWAEQDPVPATPSSADALLAAFASLEGLEATFREEKSMALLAAPLVSEGRLVFAQPGFLRREVSTPSPSLVVITPDTLSFEDASGREHIDLRARAEVREFVESLVWILAGDVAQLRATYALRFEPSDEPQGWTLAMEPLGGPLAEIIAQIVVSGSGYAVERIVVEETTGDVTTTTILSADPTRRFSDAERRTLFELDVP